MKILVTGGTGLVGRALVDKLRTRNHEVRVLTRQKNDDPNEYLWNIGKKEIDDNAFNDINCIIHLAGATVSERWTDSYKKELYSSRIDAANLLLDYCTKKNIHLDSFISASGINYYGTFTSNQILTENDSVIEDGFLAELTVQWEKAAYKFSDLANRIVCLRTAMVLAKSGGAFPLLKKLVDLNIGSGVGTGKQWMNWIHLDDLVNMYILAVENAAMEGNYNAVADETPTNKTFMKELAEASGKFFLPINVPNFIMKTVLGEMSSIILEGTRASNKKIKSLGFDFKYHSLKETFKDLV